MKMLYHINRNYLPGTEEDTENECPTDAKRQKLDSDGSVTDQTGGVNNDSDVGGVKNQTKTEEFGSGGSEDSTERISKETDDMITKETDVGITADRISKETDDMITKETDVGITADRISKETDDRISKETDVGITAERISKETDVGITEYISSLPGFNGVLKQRYSDFLVNEISLDGSVVHLTSTDLPCPLPEEPKVELVDLETVSPEDAAKLAELLKSKNQKESVLIEAPDDKNARTKVHSEIARAFPGLETVTVTKGDRRLIEVKIMSNRGNLLRQWPKGRGDYCKFVLYKENKDTMDTIGLIAKNLGLKSSLFQYVGTKDRRGKTCQQVTVFRVAPEKLKGLNKVLRNIVVGNFSYVDRPLRLSASRGNRFTVVLRAVTGSLAQIDAGMQSLTEAGFINYFGMQRFGTQAIPSHHIGRALLQEDWKTAVELILKPRVGDDAQLAAARGYWWSTRDSGASIEKFPRFSYIERSILAGLAAREQDYYGAFSKVSRNNRLMYVHAYQSYVWNLVTSQRVRQYGLKPMVGDLIIPLDTAAGNEQPEDNTEGLTDEVAPIKARPVVLDEASIGKYTIYDVVLPLPGFDSVYPDNNLQGLYKEVMEKDGLDYTNMRRKHKDFSLAGGYRHIVVRPKDVSWRLHRYDDPTSPVVLSDWDVMKGDTLNNTSTDGGHLALEFQLSLPPSCYATMAIRELLKIDTSSNFQSSLNVT
ncbi:pseudouridylate synthase 7 homolog isoform X2 [Dreissena polymorpha]|uniref:pseudouridylate synthase 7 homolog isoform X2 n=1 Tax=Dreissena polymorpha TaxID=45954 RepID=UPI00226490A0|nr:pseudouridylate synthase 7 homolog isoform X2 [Dreissena polymorpha]